MMRKAIAAMAAMTICLTACAAPAAPKIETVEEKIGNLTIQAPVGWEKNVDDSYDLFTSYSYKKVENDKGIAFLTIYFSKDAKEDLSVSDFDYLFNEEHDGIDIVFNHVDDTFIGDKPVRQGSGTWQTNYDGTVGDLYDLTRAAMYDADHKQIQVDYMYLDEKAKEGYADYADTLMSTMQLIYDYQYTTE